MYLWYALMLSFGAAVSALFIPTQFQLQTLETTSDRINQPKELNVDILLPERPFMLMLNHLEAFVFRLTLPEDDKLKVKISLVEGRPNPDGARAYRTLTDLSSLTVHQGVQDYLVSWLPRVEDGIPEEGGRDYFLVVKKTSWWGWREQVIFESDPMTILPDYDTEKA